MGIRTAALCAAAALVLAAGATGCSSEDTDPGGRPPPAEGPGGEGGPSGGSPGTLPEQSRFPVPKGYDNTRGWTEAVSEPDSRTHGSWAVGPSSGVFVQVMNAEGKVHARTLGSGAETWTFQPEVKLERARTNVYVEVDEEGSGEEFAVVVREGRTAGEGLERSRPLVTVDTVPVLSSGKAEAARHEEFADAGAGPFTGRLLVAAKTGSELHAYDPFTGKRQELDGLGEVRLSGCRAKDLPPNAVCSADTAVEFATTAGAVSTYTQDGYCDYRWKAEDWVPCGKGFTVGTGWRSEKAAPHGAAEATPLAVTGRYLVVLWSAFPGAETAKEAGQDVVAVHNLADGKLVARADCDITGPSSGRGSVEPLAAQHTSRQSANGEYLVSAQAGFDLGAKSGACFADTAERHGVTLTAVSDTGRAFGVTYGRSTWGEVRFGTFPHDFGSSRVSVPGRAVSADVRTGSAEPLPRRTALPVHLAEDTGLFLTAGVLAAYPSATD